MKKTLVVMMAFVLGLAFTSCKQGPKAPADAAEAAADPAKTITELVEKAKAEGANWSVDQWKDAYKTAMAAAAPGLQEMSAIIESAKPKEGEDIDTAKFSAAMAKMEEFSKKFEPVQKMLSDFDSISRSYPNGKTVAEDKEFEKQLLEEFKVPDL